MRLQSWLVLAGIAIVGCKADDRGAISPGVRVDAAPIAEKPVDHLLVVTRDAIVAHRAVDVDRRFTSALAEVGKLLGRPACTATRRADRTTITCANKAVELPELADFEELRDALALSVAELTLPAGGTAPTDDEWMLDGVVGGFDRARTAGRKWATERTQAVTLEGLHGLLATLLADQDSFGITDSIAARALALLVITERASPRPLEAALLAHVLGYETASTRLADALPPTDVVRGFLTRPLAASTRTEADEHASPLALYLAHRVLLEAGEAERAAKIRARMGYGLQSQTGVQATRLLAPRTREALTLGPLLPWLGLADARELSGQAAARGKGYEDEAAVKALGAADRPEVLRRLAAAVATIDKSGAFVDGGIVDDHFRALVASADDVYRAGTPLMGCASCKTLRESSDVLVGDQKIEMPELDEGANLGEAATRPEVYRASLEWMRMNSMLASGKTSHQTMPDYLRDARGLFGAPIEDVLPTYWSRIPWARPVQVEVEHEIEHLADSRPTHRPLLATLAFHLYELTRYFQLGRSWRSVAGARASVLSNLMTIGDGYADRVRARLADEHAPVAERRKAYEALDEAGKLEPGDRKAMAALLVRPGASAADGALAAQLLEEADPRGAEAACKKWLTQHPEEASTRIGASVMTELAGLQRARKDYATAQKTIEPALAHGGYVAIHRAALIRLASGDVNGAESIAQANMRMHPDPTSIGMTAEMLLRGKHYAAAAELLAKPPVPLDRQAIGWYVGRAIAPAIPDVAALHAFADELRRVHFNLSTLDDLGYVFDIAGRHELAFEAVSMTPAEGFAVVEKVNDAYPNLVAARGAEAADRWLKETLPRSLLIPFATRVALKGEVDVLFSVVPDPPSADRAGDQLWATRLVALELKREVSGPRWERVRTHYANGAGGSYYDDCARFTLGLTPFDAVDKAIDDPTKLPEAGLILGAGALVKGHIDEAVDWMQVSARTRARDAPAYEWSHQLLTQVAQSRLGPELLVEKWAAR